MFPEGSVSPNSQNFAEFTELGRIVKSCYKIFIIMFIFISGSNLNPNQSLTKCPKCDKPSVVEKSIAQCQEVNSCGYIFCQKCDSYSYDPKEFYDRLVNDRRRLKKALERFFFIYILQVSRFGAWRFCYEETWKARRFD